MTTVKCCTRFDITATGVTGHYKSARKPFLTEAEWNRARNQQRNWETLQQLISLRTQIINLTAPTKSNGIWCFEFSSDTPDVFGNDNNPTQVLKQDANGVPMLGELDNESDIDMFLVTEGTRQNIWFTPITINI